MASTTGKGLRIAGAALVLTMGLLQAALALDAVTTSPTKIYAAVNDPFSFTVTLPAGNTTSSTDLLVSYTANTTSPVIVPYLPCIDPATPSPYTGAPANSKYVNWDAGVAIFPSAAVCGAAAGAITLATFSGIATTIPGGAYTVQVLNGFANGDTNVTSNDVTICQKPTVTSVTAPVPAPEGTNQQFTVNFTPAIAAGCGGVTIPVVLSGPATNAPDSANILSSGCTAIAAGNATCAVTVQSTDNAAFNGDQAMTLTVTDSAAGDNYISSGKSAVGTVQDNESGISVVLGRNGAEGGNSVQFNITCIRGSAASAPAAATVNLAWAGAAPAATGVDFVGGLPGSFPVNCTTGAGTVNTLGLPVFDDALVEGTENLQVTISSGTANVVAVAPTSATATVADNDTPPVFGVTKSGACAEAVVPVNCQFDIVRESGVSGPFTVNFNVTGTATRGTDYTLHDTTCGGALIPTGTNSVSHTQSAPSGVFTIAVCVIDDLFVEGTETVILSLAAASPAGTYTLGAVSSQTQNIADDDSPQVVTIASSGSPAEQGLVPGTFTLTRTGGSAAAQAATLTVNVTTGGTATLGASCVGAAHYTRTGMASATTVTFAAGTATAQVVITPCDDLLINPGQTATLTVAAPTVSTDYTVGTPPANTASLTIIDNDTGLGVVASAATIIEGGTAVFTISCPAGSGQASVDYAFSGTYTPLPANGNAVVICGTPTVINVPTIDDAVVNDTRSITMTLSNVLVANAPAAFPTSKRMVAAKTLVLDPANTSATVLVLDNDRPNIIPTMGTLGLLLLGLLLAVSAGTSVRRRRS